MCGQEELDGEATRPREREDMVGQWVTQIDMWAKKIDRGMGEGGAADDADPADEEAGSRPDPAPRPAGG